MLGLLIFGAIGLLINGLMIYGIMKKSSGFLLPWIIVTIIDIVLETILTFVAVTLTGQIQQVVGSAVGLSLKGYFLNCVYSHYKELQVSSHHA